MSDDCCDDDEAWNRERLAATEALIIKYEAAIDALSTGAQSYQLDTGQSRQQVYKADLGNIQRTLARLEARREQYRAKLSRCGNFNVRPGW